jgi:hypothetical protein
MNYTESPEIPFVCEADPQRRLELLRHNLHLVYQELRWEMKDVIDECIKNYWVDVSAWGGYRDLVNGLLSVIESIIEQERDLARWVDVKHLFLLKWPNWYEKAIKNVDILRVYHFLLASNEDFARAESLISPDSHRPRNGSPYEILYMEVRHDKEAYLKLVNDLPFSVVFTRYQQWKTSEILEWNTETKLLPVVNQ